MINLRYHIVSLVAVFLALGLGILMGSTVIDQGIVSQLRTRTEGLAHRSDQLRADNDTLGRELALWDTFARSLLPPLVRGKLAGRRGVLVVQDGVKSAAVDGVVQALADAGASISGRVALTDRWLLKDEPSRERLAAALGVSETSHEALLALAAGRLAGRLGQSRDPGASGDLLAALRDAEFVTLDGAGDEFPPAGAFVVIVSAGLREHRPMNERVLVPLLQALAPARRVTVVEPLSSADSLADRIRADAGLRAAVSTVDDADITLGRLSLVYAARAVIVDGVGAHFGARRSATALVPSLRP